MLNDIASSVLTFVEQNIALVEPMVFSLGLAESTMFLSLLVPSSVLLVGIGGLHSAAGGEFWSVVAAASVGAWAGDIGSFAIGRYFKDDIVRVWPLNRHKDWYEATRLFVARRGAPGIVISKFFGMLRPFVPALAGAAGMAWPVFLISSAISCVLWAAVFLAPGYGITLLFS